ncbi:hypothetical protein HOL24_04005 [bacterium]|jgi:hypothetical protein|nr:hypothetical protein [bacterium]
MDIFKNDCINDVVIIDGLTRAGKFYLGKLTTDVDDYIEFYNHQRFHQTLDYKKPMDVYQESIKLNQNKKKAS